MKKLTDDLTIKGIELSIARLGATVTFIYLERYEAKAFYLRKSNGYKWFETEKEVPQNVHDVITEEVEENEDAILDWVEEQFAKETDQVDPEVETLDILQLQKKNMADLMLIASTYEIKMEGLGKQELIYKILDEQAKA